MPVRYQKSSPPLLGRRDAPKSIDLGGAIPRHLLPISPPETERVTPSVITESRQFHSRTSSQSLHDGLQVTPPTATGESPSKHRPSPGISYVQSGLSRIHPAPIRPSRWLVVVMPPSSLNSEPALGHTLSTGPPGRFQSGILMPLFPTLYGQLAAISKEFSLPSTTGVCIYIHVSDRGLNMAPRISDEAWQLLWGHYFIPDEGAPSYPSHQLPICGQIEFDVDIRKARWYESWVSGHVRHPSLEAAIPPAIAQSLSKWYHDAIRDRDEEPDAHDDTASVHGKHIPRPLALGRREGSVRSIQRYKAVNGREGDAESTVSRAIPHRLSPVKQAGEPATAKQHDLNTLVRNWRATTPAVPALPREEDTAKDTLDSPGFELDLDDFQWSISSAGPAWHSDNDESADAHSVDLEARLRGSVALTPSVATSFGPDDVPTPAFSNVSRYPSPDIAARFRESAPISPVTATSWGAPLSWPTTPASVERVLSPDLANRAVFSRPETPMTVTSWGAPEHWPTSPFESFRPYTPDMGFREQHSRPATPSTATSWGAPEYWPPSPIEHTRPHTPDYAQRAYDEDYPASFNHAKPWTHVWPFPEIRKEHQRALLESKHGSFRFVWPFIGKGLQATIEPMSREPLNAGGSVIVMELETNKEADPFAFVWPFFRITRPRPSPQSVVVPSTYPFLQIYRPVYPHVNEVYASKSVGEFEVPKCQSVRLHNACACDYPELVIYPLKDSDGNGEESWRARTIDAKVKVAYPNFDLYPAVYPFVCPYPVSGDLDNLKIRSVLLGSEAPEYPVFDVYNTGVVTRPAPAPWSVRLQTAHLAIALYTGVYPLLTIYPPVVETVSLKAQPVLLPANPVIGVYGPASAQVLVEPKSVAWTGSYGRLNLYPATYPHIEPYPPCDAVEPKAKEVLLPSSEYHYPAIGIYGPAFQTVVPEPCSASLPRSYGRLNLYPACYPNLEIYPATDPVQTKKQSVLLASQECEYPDLLIYPGCRPVVSFRPRELPVMLRSAYGRLSLYPATYPPEPYLPMDPVELKVQSVLETDYEYPAIVIYPGCTCAGLTNIPVELPTRLPVAYPFFDLYPVVYPFVELYPNAHIEKIVPITPEFTYPDVVIYAPVRELIRPTYIDVKLPRTQGYPFFDLYEPGYPVICPYPAVCGPTKVMTLEEPKLRSVKLTACRHVAYPNIEPYAPLADRPTPQLVRLSVAYPAFDLYPALDSIYPSIEPAAQCMKLSPLQNDGYVYPNIIIYQPLGRLQLRPAFPKVTLTPRSPMKTKRRCPSSRSWDHLPPVPPLPSHVLDLAHRGSVNLHDSYKFSQPLPESAEDVPVLLEQSVPASKPRKTHAQLYLEVFRGVQRESPQQLHPGAMSIPSPNSHRIKRRKAHQELWQEVFPNGPEADDPPLASPVAELPTFNQTPRLGRSRSASIVRTQPGIGISRTPSLRSSRPLPPVPAPLAPLQGRARAMSRATVRATVEAEPSTRTKQISNSFLSRPAEGSPSDQENLSVSMSSSQVRRVFEPVPQRSGSIVQRTAHMLTHSDDPEPAPTGPRLSRTPSKLDRSKFPFA